MSESTRKLTLSRTTIAVLSSPHLIGSDRTLLQNGCAADGASNVNCGTHKPKDIPPQPNPPLKQPAREPRGGPKT